MGVGGYLVAARVPVDERSPVGDFAGIDSSVQHGTFRRGPVALLTNQPRNATVKTLTECLWLADDPELRRNIHQLAITRVRANTRQPSLRRCR